MMKKSNTGCSTTRRAILGSPPEPTSSGTFSVSCNSSVSCDRIVLRFNRWSGKRRFRCHSLAFAAARVNPRGMM